MVPWPLKCEVRTVLFSLATPPPSKLKREVAFQVLENSGIPWNSGIPGTLRHQNRSESVSPGVANPYSNGDRSGSFAVKRCSPIEFIPSELAFWRRYSLVNCLPRLKVRISINERHTIRNLCGRTPTSMNISLHRST